MSIIDESGDPPSKKLRAAQKKLNDEKNKELLKPKKPRPGDIESKKFDLVFQEKVVLFKDPRIGWVYTKNRIHIKNPTKNRYTYKVKCTNNEMFDIRAPIGFIEPLDSVDVEVLHCPGILIPENDWHHFSVYYIKCDKDAQDYCLIWKSRKPEGCKHVPIRFSTRRIGVGGGEEGGEREDGLTKVSDLEKSMKKLEEEVKKLEANGDKEKKEKEKKKANMPEGGITKPATINAEVAVEKKKK